MISVPTTMPVFITGPAMEFRSAVVKLLKTRFRVIDVRVIDIRWDMEPKTNPDLANLQSDDEWLAKGIEAVRKSCRQIVDIDAMDNDDVIVFDGCLQEPLAFLRVFHPDAYRRADLDSMTVAARAEVGERWKNSLYFVLQPIEKNYPEIDVPTTENNNFEIHQLIGTFLKETFEESRMKFENVPSENVEKCVEFIVEKIHFYQRGS